MKRLLLNLIFVLFVLFPVSVFATGNITASPSSLSIEVGSSKTFTITATNTIGDVSITSSNTNVAKVSIGEWGTGMVEEGQTKSGTVTVTGVNTGTAIITLTLDAATFDGEDLAGQTRTITVSIIPKAVPNNSTPKNNTPSNSNVNPGNTQTKSNNNSIKEISVEGYDLTKVDNNNYSLSVTNNVTSINVKATAEDSKATVTGAGKHDLNIGENNIEIVVTAENGSQNKINIKVTRKDGYYLEDLDTVLKNNKVDDINIIIKSDTKITSSDFEKIKQSKKTVKFNYYNTDKSLLYSWIVDGSKLKNTSELITTISNDSDNKKDMLQLSNYADGLFVGLKQTKNLPTGAKLRLFVGDKYKNNDVVNVYSYKKNSDNIQLVEKKLKVKDGYIEFDVIDDASDYFVTMSTIPSSEKVVTKTEKSSPVLFVIIGILLLVVVCLVIALIIKNRKNKKDNNIITDNSEVLATDPNPNNNSNSVITDSSEVLTTDPNTDNNSNSVVNDNTEVLTTSPNPDDNGNNVITDSSEVLTTSQNPDDNSNSVMTDNSEVLTPNPNPNDIINNNQNITMENGSSFEQPKIIVSETVNESNIMSDNQSEL